MLVQELDQSKYLDLEFFNPYRYTWRKLFSSKLIGFIQARLYQDHLNLSNLEQDFTLTFGRDSWLDLKDSVRTSDWTIFNTSSYASLSLWNHLESMKARFYLNDQFKSTRYSSLRYTKSQNGERSRSKSTKTGMERSDP